MKNALLICGLLTLFFLNACQKDTTAIATDIDCSTITYSGNIQSLIQQNCAGSSCHGSGGREGSLMTYSELKKYVDNGAFRSQVLDRQTMPEGGHLSSTQLGQIKCWLDSGALNN